jgi:polyisoprenoid-binding protein YceI
MMNKVLIAFSLVSGLFLASCGGSDQNAAASQEQDTTADSTTEISAAPVKQAPPVEEKVFEIDKENSTITWIGRKVGEEHTGNLKPKIGMVGWGQGKVIHGVVEMDMNSITCTDIESPEKNKKLVSHLKNKDFFDVANYPTASFAIMNFEVNEEEPGKYSAGGDLFIKNKSNPLVIETGDYRVEGNKLYVSGSFDFDRVVYDIHYKSKTIFPELADKFIEDLVTVQYDLVFVEQVHE